jgi:hypothetical protein
VGTALAGYTAFITAIGLPPKASTTNTEKEVTPTTLNLD